jgi:hypothetical protein
MPTSPRSRPLPCWRCKDQGFVRNPCQVCGAWRTAAGEIAYVAPLWGPGQVQPARPKPRRTRRDRP